MTTQHADGYPEHDDRDLIKLLNDPDLEEAAETYLDNEQAARQFAQAKRFLKKNLPKEEGVFRVGPAIIRRDPIAGGGYEVRRWQSLTTKVTSIE